MDNRPNIKIATATDDVTTYDYFVMFYDEIGKHVIVVEYWKRNTFNRENIAPSVAAEELFGAPCAWWTVQVRGGAEAARRWVNTATEPDDILRHYCRKFASHDEESERWFAEIKAAEQLHRAGREARAAS